MNFISPTNQTVIFQDDIKVIFGKECKKSPVQSFETAAAANFYNPLTTLWNDHQECQTCLSHGIKSVSILLRNNFYCHSMKHKIQTSQSTLGKNYRNVNNNHLKCHSNLNFLMKIYDKEIFQYRKGSAYFLGNFLVKSIKCWMV